MDILSLDYKKGNTKNAQHLRRNATPQERHLWYDFLSRYPIRFQRQKPIGDYIADFYCHQAKLVIELDGSQHYWRDGEERDVIRTQALEKYGLRVLRFTDYEVNNNFSGVCHQIDLEVTSILKKE